MALLKRRPKTSNPRDAACPHDQRDPRWREMAHAGDATLIDHYICRACGQKLDA